MLMKRTFANVLLLVSFALFGKASPESGFNGLRCELQLNEGDTLTTSLSSHFHFLLLSDRDLQVFKDTNMWGYFARSFTLEVNSKKYEITRRERGWDKNWPAPVTLYRGKVLVTNLYLCDGSWQASPKLPTKSPFIHIRISGNYALRPEDDPPKSALMEPIDNLWHGSITSAPLELDLTRACTFRLNSDKK